jgi:hypothetical protein
MSSSTFTQPDAAQRRYNSGATYEPARSHAGVTIWKAYLGLIGTHVMLRVAGYRTIRRHLATCTPSRRLAQRSQPIDVASIIDIVDWALVYYPTPVKCLQRSILITWLLKRRDVPAQLVIGCQHTPFYAHAWVELNGDVINDPPSIREQYIVMERV